MYHILSLSFRLPLSLSVSCIKLSFITTCNQKVQRLLASHSWPEELFQDNESATSFAFRHSSTAEYMGNQSSLSETRDIALPRSKSLNLGRCGECVGLCTFRCTYNAFWLHFYSRVGKFSFTSSSQKSRNPGKSTR